MLDSDFTLLYISFGDYYICFDVYAGDRLEPGWAPKNKTKPQTWRLLYGRGREGEKKQNLGIPPMI